MGHAQKGLSRLVNAYPLEARYGPRILASTQAVIYDKSLSPS
jgi:hypothetical protein